LATPPADVQVIPIYLDNFVFGPAHLLHLTLPEGWRIQRGFSHPEIHATHVRRGQTWVASADAWYVLAHEQEPWLLEFHLRVLPKPTSRAAEGERWPLGVGHAGTLVKRTVRRGPPWRRQPTPQWALTWYCPETERGFRLEVTGRVPEEALRALFQAWRHVDCHPQSPTQTSLVEQPEE